jgi:hypothetical protein
MAALVDLAGPAFKSPGSMHVFAERLGSTVAELRSGVADAIAPRLKSSGMSKSAARNRALAIAFDKPELVVAALLTHRASASVLDALMAAAREAGVVQ